MSVGGAAYLIYLSQSLALTCGGLLALLALVALRYGSFQRDSQRAYQNELANTNQVKPAPSLIACSPPFLSRFIPTNVLDSRRHTALPCLYFDHLY